VRRPEKLTTDGEENLVWISTAAPSAKQQAAIF
jgi:hypothetical protein